MKKLFLCFALILSLLVTGCSLFSFEEDGSYAMTIDGEKISVGEFSVYLYEQKATFEQTGGTDIWETDFNGTPAADVAKENAYNSIIYVKTACKNADDIGVSLTDEDKAEAKSLAEEALEKMNADYVASVGLTQEQTEEIMEEIILHQKVMESVTKTFLLSEADFSAYVDDYQAENPDDKTPRASLESSLRETYIKEKKDEIYKDQIKSWAEDTVVEKNEAVWAEIDITVL
ncbi:MAG: SurA N-terminal domain-containing protein [Eubacterium sp.]|nr:SurA N-terminal domain-containing protein [Eubacterium sp.]